MGWKEISIMSQRIEFVTLAMQENQNISELCKRFQISRKTGYKFLKRYKEQGFIGLTDHSRRPLHSPTATHVEIEQLILRLRDKHPGWGGRKLRRRLQDLGTKDVPSPSTITSILKRNDRICDEESDKHRPWQRFEAERPNDLWQMDFKGHFEISNGRCHPLTIMDDNSRYSLCIDAHNNECKESVERSLTNVFCRYGMPYSILMDNGNPWGGDRIRKYTGFTVWLIRLGIKVIHSRPRHPQTLGKEERFHRTMNAEVVGKCLGKTIIECQQLFDDWRLTYNQKRPHEALGMNVPAYCYEISRRKFPEKLPEVEYSDHDKVRKVQSAGIIHYLGKEYKVGGAFRGEHVALRETEQDGRLDVYFCSQKISQITLI